MNALSFRGSTWNRWEPHIHTPGTILNNQFSGPDGGWDEYVNRINNSDPKIRALGEYSGILSPTIPVTLSPKDSGNRFTQRFR